MMHVSSVWLVVEQTAGWSLSQQMMIFQIVLLNINIQQGYHKN